MENIFAYYPLNKQPRAGKYECIMRLQIARSNEQVSEHSILLFRWRVAGKITIDFALRATPDPEPDPKYLRKRERPSILSSTFPCLYRRYRPCPNFATSDRAFRIKSTRSNTSNMKIERLARVPLRFHLAFRPSDSRRHTLCTLAGRCDSGSLRNEIALERIILIGRVALGQGRNAGRTP